MSVSPSCLRLLRGLTLLPLLLPAARAAAPDCPPPAPTPDALLTPDGTAHVLTRAPGLVCWWAVSEDGDVARVRRFTVAPTARITWSWCADVGAIRFIADDPAVGTVRRWLDPYTGADVR